MKIRIKDKADSTCLLHWPLLQNYNITDTHLHHEIREEAELDVEHYQKIFKDLNLALEAKRIFSL